MCGIFGVTLGQDAEFSRAAVRGMVNDLFTLSASRGSEAAGVAISVNGRIQIYKDAVSPAGLIRSTTYTQMLDEAFGDPLVSRNGHGVGNLTIVGHSRLVTNGTNAKTGNNQPVVYEDTIGVHNGIVVNDEALWKSSPEIERHSEVDTEVVLALMHVGLKRHGSVAVAARDVFQRIEGTASIAVLFAHQPSLLLATNNGSLYRWSRPNLGLHVFASEFEILRQLMRRGHGPREASTREIRQLRGGSACLVDLATGTPQEFPLQSGAFQPFAETARSAPWRIDRKVGPNGTMERSAVGGSPTMITTDLGRRFDIDMQPITALHRCTRCVLPATMPFIHFDEAGVCNYCRHYRVLRELGAEALADTVQPSRRGDGAVDCLVPISGGRDSSFGLHYVRNVMKMTPVSYTYDWGMITDLARRNIARVCGKLGVENILVSADIQRKRTHIRKNLLAWLRHPDLGTVPLLMAGDKQYFFYANRLRRRLGIELIIYCDNRFEKTHFKSGFSGVRPRFGGGRTYALGLAGKIKLATYYGRRSLANPGYLNQSLVDTLWAYGCYYFMPHQYVDLFRYVPWNEQAIVSTLIDEYDWEVAADSETTWRIGDGTAPFYNYIYLCIAGFTENDTFRSNQIRDGHLTRRQALQIIARENEPRFEAIRWYCETIGVDTSTALQVIQAAPKMYSSDRL